VVLNKITKNFLGTSWPEWLGITMGSLIIALSLDIFLIPCKIAAGGFSGLATILYYLFGWPVGLVAIILNVPLFIIAWCQWGFLGIARALYGMLVLSIGIDFLVAVGIPTWTDNLLLAAIYGGIGVGVGLGFVFRCRATTGGTDMTARLIFERTRFSLGNMVFILDGIIIVLAGLVFNVEMAMYALISVFVSSRVVDVVQNGFTNEKAVWIISDKTDALAVQLLQELSRGLTGFASRGIYTGTRRETLLCVVPQSELAQLKKEIHYIDKDAFIIITAAHEVYGEGFKKVEQIKKK